MASKRRRRRRECTNKERYWDLSSAVRHSERLMRIRIAQYHAYKCDFCRGFHVGRFSRQLC